MKEIPSYKPSPEEIKKAENSITENQSHESFVHENVFNAVPPEIQEELKNPERWTDKSFVMKMLEINGLALNYASLDLSNDREVVLAAINQNPAALEYASPELRGDRELVIAATRKAAETYRSILWLASPELQDDKELALIAIKAHETGGYALSQVSPRLQDDKDVVLAAINQLNCAAVFRYASKRLRADREVVLAAIEADHENFLKVSDQSLWGDKEIALAAVSKNKRYLRNIELMDRELLSDPDIQAAAAQAYDIPLKGMR